MTILNAPWGWLRGIDVPAWIVATLRGALEAAALAGILVLIASVSAADFGEAHWLGPLLLQGLRTLEGVADQIDPEKKRVNGTE